MNLKPEPGEAHEAWLARAVPALMEAEGLDEAGAKAKAEALWGSAQAEGEDDEEDMDWDQSTWGESMTTDQGQVEGATQPAPAAGAAPATPGTAPDASAAAGGVDQFMGHLGTLGRMLLDRLIQAGIVPPDQKPTLLAAVNEKFPPQQMMGDQPVAATPADPTVAPSAKKPPPFAKKEGEADPEAEPQAEGEQAPESEGEGAEDEKKKKPTKKPAFIKALADLEFSINLQLPDPAPSTKSQDDILARWMGTKGFAGPILLNHKYRGDGHDLTIKALSADRVGAYLCAWGAPFHADLVDEYFTPNTKGMTEIFKEIGKIPALYHHAMDKALKSAVIGLIDTMEKDDVGLWVEAQIRRHEEYRKMIKPLVDQRMLGWSSGAVPGGKEVKANGEITYWPIYEGSMTPTPMEWRMTTKWPIGHLKSAYEIAGLPTDRLKFRETEENLINALAFEQERLRIISLQ